MQRLKLARCNVQSEFGRQLNFEGRTHSAATKVSSGSHAPTPELSGEASFLYSTVLVLCVITSCSPSEETQAKDQAQSAQAAAQQENVNESVYVKYRGPVNLAPFNCEWVTRSSVIQRLCYDSKEQYVIVSLAGTYYHYCEVPPEIVSQWCEADSIGRYYNAQTKERFDCRVNRMPAYPRQGE